MPCVLWWGRFDPGYSRNRILRKQFIDLGWQLRDFHPKYAPLGDWEAWLNRMPKPDLVWVPCFRQRDLAAAARWAKRQGVPVAFDPLISAYDKQVGERGKLTAGSAQANTLLSWERELFMRPDLVLADTPAHAAYFAETLGVKKDRLAVVYVGAEETLFKPEPQQAGEKEVPLEALFYGSFIQLQGPEVVIEAARLYQGPPVKWTLLGQGPLRKLCEERAAGLENVSFENWLPYEKLPGRIHRANVLLGVFGATPKAGRVIPNKVYQALACGRAVITRPADAYPDSLRNQENSGLIWSPGGDAHSLANHLAVLAADRDKLRRLGEAAAATSQKYFSEAVVRSQLNDALENLTA